MMTNADPIDLRAASDDDLWKQCRWEAFRGSGPGGQKRNKTSSAVRVVHEPTGMAAVASESRSQAENRARAFRRLRKALAMEIRRPVEARPFVAPEWLDDLVGSRDRKIAINARHSRFLPLAGLTLDLLQATSGSVADAAKLLGVSTANLVSYFDCDDVLWDYANRIRQASGLKSLKRV